MKRNKSQFSRLLELDKRIRQGLYPNCLNFSADWEVSQKTVQRDIDFLRDSLNAPIDYDREKKGFYYTTTQWFMPSISVSEGDLVAILVAEKALEQYRGTPIAAELERVFSKITDLLPDKITVRPELIFNKFSFTTPPTRAIDMETWSTVVRGLVNQKWLSMVYQSPEKGITPGRMIASLHMANLQGEWYLFGKIEGEDRVRQFSIGRIQSVKLTDRAFDTPADFDPKTLLANTFGRYVLNDHNHSVRLLFNKEVATWVLEKQWGPKQVIRNRKNGDIELSFSAAGVYEVFRWVMAWGRWVTVLAPTELKKMVDEEITAMCKVRRGKRKG
jgi:predicted DNA-binding transcriptional regulator YafY